MSEKKISERCTQCGAENASMGWYKEYCKSVEYIRLKCNRCGYEWEEKALNER